MAAELKLAVERRVKVGKGPVRTLRNEGYVPGIYYDAKGENIPVKVKEVPLSKAYQKVGTSHVLTLDIEGEEKPAFIWQVEPHPFKNQTVHVDFYGADMTKPVRVFVDVEVQGKAKGTVEGGVLTVFRDKIEVHCLPADVPHGIAIDVSELDINDSVTVSQLSLPMGVEAVYQAEEDFAVVGVVPPVSEVEEEEIEGEEIEAAEAEEAETE